MRSIITIASLAFLLAACDQVTPININPTTGVATEPVAPTTGPMAPLLSKYEADLTAAYNLAGQKPVDKLALSCYGALVNLNNLLAKSPVSSQDSGVLTMAESVRRSMLASQSSQTNTVAMAAIDTCNQLVTSDKVLGLSVAPQLGVLLLSIEQGIL